MDKHALARISAVLREVWDEHPADGPVDVDAPFLRVGLDSLTLVILLDRVEREFGVRWDPDDPPGPFSTLRSLAERAARDREPTE